MRMETPASSRHCVTCRIVETSPNGLVAQTELLSPGDLLGRSLAFPVLSRQPNLEN